MAMVMAGSQKRELSVAIGAAPGVVPQAQRV
jgi:hypothetical protein